MGECYEWVTVDLAKTDAGCNSLAGLGTPQSRYYGHAEGISEMLTEREISEQKDRILNDSVLDLNVEDVQMRESFAEYLMVFMKNRNIVNC